MIHERDVRAKIAAFLSNEISVEDFSLWIMSNSWNMHKDSSAEAVDLVSSIHLLLAERDDNSYSPEEFRSELESLLNKIVVSYPPAHHVVPKRYFSANSARQWLSIARPLAA